MLNCRGCGAELRSGDRVADLGAMPLANALLSEDGLYQPEVHYPLLALVCRECLLVQLPNLVDPKTLFPATYPFRSGVSGGWLAHCKEFADQAVSRFGLGPTSRVLEIGSNDGAGLYRFRHHGILALGVEPCREVAIEALNYGIATAIEWWSADYARQLKNTGYSADLVIGRNVLAHVPDLQDFLYGVRTILAPGGTVVFEVPYVALQIAERRWDQIYHEHHCYFSVSSLRRALSFCGFRLWDLEQVPIHGGSIRAYASMRPSHDTGAADRAIQAERNLGLNDLDTYLNFAAVPPADKKMGLAMLSQLKGRVVGYGASAKAATLLNYFGVGPELVECVVDTTPAKWGRYLPGSRIPITTPTALEHPRADAVINFCWNWPEESERRIRDATDAPIVYFHPPVPTEVMVS